MDPVAELLNEIAGNVPRSRLELRRLKLAAAARTHGPLIRNDALLARYRRDVALGRRAPDHHLEQALALNRIRSESGVATITVITAPYACPGRCVYCPTEAHAPKSYLTNEPAMMRAVRNEYDPYRQVCSRLEALDQTGHLTEKIELIIKGGTWSFYPETYQRWFIRRCFEAANRGPDASPQDDDTPSLTQAQQMNETARQRIIGITIETRPDYIDLAELRRLRELGVTRVELGVQTLDEQVLALIVRDHGTAQVRAATRLLRDAGFKVAYHLMPNLPGATLASDLETARRLFDDPSFCPDAIKLYPCVVIDSAELFQWWQTGRYVPYDDDTLIELLIQIKQLVPPFVRIERVIRDIPSTSIRAGCAVTNLRELVQQRLRGRGLRCQCIRCRQVREPTDGAFRLVRRRYQTDGGEEIFLSFEDPGADTLASLLRLRIPTPRTTEPLSPTLQDAALIRELHTYGPHLSLHQRTQGAAQHRGFGAQLLHEAERIARDEHHCPRLAVIAGVGVREYYRRFGYELEDTYMVKQLINDMC